MFLLDWYRQYLNIKYEARERKNLVTIDEKICQSCETLKAQLEIANYEKKQLLDRLLFKPEAPPERTEGPIITPPRNIPWHVRRQMLEREDREKARALREAATPDSSPATVDVSDLEKALGVAEQEREAEAKS